MTTFNEREKGFEQKYKHDQDLQFKVNARRNKLLGLWAAEQMGLSGADAEAYAKQVVQADFEKPGDSDVVAKVVNDLSAKGRASRRAAGPQGARPALRGRQRADHEADLRPGAAASSVPIGLSRPIVVNRSPAASVTLAGTDKTGVRSCGLL